MLFRSITMTPAEITQEESVEKRTGNRVLVKAKALNLGREEGSSERTERKQPVRGAGAGGAPGEHGVREPSHQGASRAAPGKSGLHERGEGARVIVLESWEGTRSVLGKGKSVCIVALKRCPA